MRALRWTALVLFGLVVAAGPVRPAALQTLEIASKTGVHAFSVELVENDEDRAKGLMFRKELVDGAGAHPVAGTTAVPGTGRMGQTAGVGSHPRSAYAAREVESAV